MWLKNMKTVGIIGGLGPKTTANFYLEVIFSCFKRNKLQRPPMLIFNVPLSFRIEKDVIVNANNENRLLPFLIEAAKRLERGGADFIVVPCNTVHVFIEQIRRSVRIPVLSIVEETGRFLAENGIKKVGVLGTSTTIKKRLYDGLLREKGINMVVPIQSDQITLGRIIIKLVTNKHKEQEKTQLLKIINTLSDKGVDTFLLACTDLQLLLSKHGKIKIFDTMEILAHATVKELLR